ncbi:MAG: sialic acid synthase SpsE [Colwellia sp.]|jgi:sialic acid synthase SpsE
MTIVNFWSKLSMPIFLPDIGTFFNKDIKLAKKLVKELQESGVKVIKGEILHDANICLNTDTTEKYYGHQSGDFVNENYRQLIERKVLPLEHYLEIFNYAKSLNMEVILSVYDFEGADFAKKIECMAIKISSSNITHQPLIEYIADLNLPMIFDTGHASLEEATRAISWAKDKGNNDLLVEHSPPAPPNDVELHNLNFMKTLAQANNIPFGLSDHHYGDEMLYAATAMGAAVLEKGVGPNNMPDEHDGGHALEIKDVKKVIKKIANIAQAMGTGDRYLSRTRTKYTPRMGLITKEVIRAGETINIENTTFAFPALGIPTEYWSEVEGFKVMNDIKKNTILKWSDIHG